MNAGHVALLGDTLVTGESRMLNPLISWLAGRRWIRDDSRLYLEFPINGRRVDLATLTKTGVLSAFELKLGSFARVLEQATYNSLSFDRSWAVVGSPPKKQNVANAQDLGIGIIVVAEDRPHVILSPGSSRNNYIARARIAHRMQGNGGRRV